MDACEARKCAGDAASDLVAETNSDVTSVVKDKDNPSDSINETASNVTPDVVHKDPSTALDRLADDEKVLHFFVHSCIIESVFSLLVETC